eukprot:Selendium_serpulae@DN1407_c0_g1_i1.p1
MWNGRDCISSPASSRGASPSDSATARSAADGRVGELPVSVVRQNVIKSPFWDSTTSWTSSSSPTVEARVGDAVTARSGAERGGQRVNESVSLSSLSALS